MDVSCIEGCHKSLKKYSKNRKYSEKKIPSDFRSSKNSDSPKIEPFYLFKHLNLPSHGQVGLNNINNKCCGSLPCGLSAIENVIKRDG